jgi:hypothetical protein
MKLSLTEVLNVDLVDRMIKKTIVDLTIHDMYIRKDSVKIIFKLKCTLNYLYKKVLLYVGFLWLAHCK